MAGKIKYPLFFKGRCTAYLFLLVLSIPFLISGSRFNPPAVPCKPLHAPPVKEVPILCYHNIAKSPDKVNELWISEAQLDQQMQTLYDSGFHTIVPGQLYDHLTKGVPLPPKPVMISFDDTHESHFSIAAPILEKYGFRGVFFFMTNLIGKKKYISERQIKKNAEKYHAIEIHTYDHPSVKNITGDQWEQQLDKPKKRLEAISGKPVEHFAYPFGVWNAQAITELKKRGIKSAYQLTGKRSPEDPLFTIERLLVQGNWSGRELIRHIAVSDRHH